VDFDVLTEIKPMRINYILCILLFLGQLASAETALQKSARHDAIETVQAAAVAAKMPTGFFGTQWLMTPEEVKAKRPNLKLSKIGRHFETKEFYGRPAVLNYIFSERDNILIMIVASFTEKYSQRDFDKTQARLEKDFRKLPEPKPAKGRLLESFIIEGGIALEHTSILKLGVKVEQIIAYKNK
jgi:hypothetical protein